MANRYHKKPKSHAVRATIALTAFLVLIITGCGSSSDTSDNVPPPLPNAEISGVAFDGLIRNGNVTVYTWDGDFGEVLGEGITNEKGEYSITIENTPTQIIALKINNGSYVEEATGLTVGLSASDYLYAITEYEQGKPINVSITYYTTVAAGYAKAYVDKGVDPKTAQKNANKLISDQLGFDILTTKPKDVTNELNASPVFTDELKYGFATASISSLTKDISVQNGDDPVHFNYNSISFAAMAYEDAAYDASLNGVGRNGILNMGIVPIDSSFYRFKTAVNMVVIASSDVNKVGISPSSVTEMATFYNNTKSELFPGPGSILSSTNPNITNITISDGELMYGDYSISVYTSSLTELKSVSLLIDGELFATKISPVSTFNIDTRVLEDGEHTFQFIAKNVIDGTTTESINVLVSNKDITISNVYPDKDYTSKIINLSASIAGSGGVISTEFIFDDSLILRPLSTTSPLIEFDTTMLEDGEHQYTIKSVNSVGTEGRFDTTFHIDNTYPVITSNIQELDFVKDFFEVSFEMEDVNNDKVEIYIDGNIEVESNEKTITHEFDSNSYTDGEHIIVGNAIDRSGNKSSESKRFYIDNTIPIVAFTNLRTGDELSGVVYLNINSNDSIGLDSTNLYIDDNYISSNIEDTPLKTISFNTYDYQEGNHKISIEAVDKAGNTNTSLVENVNFIRSKINTIYPSENSYFSSGAGTITATFDGILPFVTVRLLVNGETAQVKQNINGEIEFSYDFDQLGNGSHTLTIEAEDESGYVIRKSAVYIVDKNSPIITWGLSNTGYYTGNLLIDASINEPNFDKAELLLDGEVIKTFSGKTINYTLDTTSRGEGSKTLLLRAYDKAGNFSSSSKEIILDHSAPRFTSVNLTNGMTITGETIVQARVEYGASLKVVELFIDGVRFDADNGNIVSLTLNPGSHPEGSHTIELKATDHLNRVTTESYLIIFQHKPPSLVETLTNTKSCDEPGPNDPPCVWRHTITIKDTLPIERTTNVKFHSPSGKQPLRKEWWSDDKSTYYVETYLKGCWEGSKEALFLDYTDARGQIATIQLQTTWTGVWGTVSGWCIK